MKLALVLGLVVSASCYEPDLRNCAVRCAAVTDCAPGHACGSDGWCADPSMIDRCASTPLDEPTVVDAPGTPSLTDAAVGDAAVADAAGASDAAMPSDAAVAIDAAVPVDAPAAGCEPGCPGRCESGVCVIECMANGSCEDGVRCPDRGPCLVVCAGNNACDGLVRCGDGRCSVICSGNNSCDKGVRCDDACACDVTCSGNNSCDEPASCPGPSACESGDGCTSIPNACTSC
jgi:hypothetical protein